MGDPFPEATIDCIDCGGVCRVMVSWEPDDPPGPGDVVRYRCVDCLDMWYLVVPDPSEPR